MSNLAFFSKVRLINASVLLGTQGVARSAVAQFGHISQCHCSTKPIPAENKFSLLRSAFAISRSTSSARGVSGVCNMCSARFSPTVEWAVRRPLLHKSLVPAPAPACPSKGSFWLPFERARNVSIPLCAMGRITLRNSTAAHCIYRFIYRGVDEKPEIAWK